MSEGNGKDQNSESIVDKLALKAEEENQESEIENLEDQEQEEQQEDNSLASSEITEELAKVLGLPDSFVGKPLSEAGKSYKNTVTWESKNNRLIKNLEAKIDELSNSQKDKIEKQADKETTSELGEMPDPVTDSVGFRSWLQKRDDKILDKARAFLDENPTLKQSQEMAAREMERLTREGIKDKLPEDVNVDEIIEAWLAENENDYQDMLKSGMYNHKPQRLVKDVVNWYKANSFDSLKDTKESDINKEIHKKVKENLLNKSKSAPHSQSVKPKKEEPQTAIDRLAEKAMREARMSS